MADVSRIAGVSPTTVSFVINNQPGQTISPATKQRVLEAVRELGYKPNPAAQSLRSQRTRTIGFITDDIMWPTPAGGMIAGAHDVTDEHESALLVMHATREPGRILEVMDQLESRNVDAIVYAVVGTRAIDLPIPRAGTRTVLMNGLHDEYEQQVLPDETQGQFTATKLLVDAGHRRIRYIAGDLPSWATKQRRQGFRKALAGTGIRYSAEMTTYGNFRPDSGYDLARRALREAQRPTALMCGNDLMALGAYFAAKELGFRVPEDVSIVGYDDHVDIAAYTHPPLTTIKLPYYEMGRAAAELCMQPPESPTCRIVGCELVERSSVSVNPETRPAADSIDGLFP